jgi:hypothetical protein
MSAAVKAKGIFTPGPWRHQINRMGHIWWVLANGTEKPIHIAEVIGSTREADARLIASAPELFAALDALTALDDGDESFAWEHSSLFENARAALAKARGESL